MALSEFKQFLAQLTRLGLEYYRRYYGPYRAIVTSNQDPEKKGRIQVRCPRARLPDGNGIWVLPMMQGAGPTRGTFWPPENKDVVWIFFDNGDPVEPACYLGGWFTQEIHDDLKSSGNAPVKRGFVTPAGNRIIFDDSSGSEKITIEQKDGKIVKVSGQKVQVGDKGGSFEPMMRGSTVKRWLETHTHGHAFGPSSAPLQPFPLDGLSDDSETS